MKKLLGILLTALLLTNLLGISAMAEGNAIDFTEEPYEIHFLYRVAMEGSDQDTMVCLHYRGFVGWLKYSLPFTGRGSARTTSLNASTASSAGAPGSWVPSLTAIPP